MPKHTRCSPYEVPELVISGCSNGQRLELDDEGVPLHGDDLHLSGNRRFVSRSGG